MGKPMVKTTSKRQDLLLGKGPNMKIGIGSKPLMFPQNSLLPSPINFDKKSKEGSLEPPKISDIPLSVQVTGSG
jgi:hypothetical protein